MRLFNRIYIANETLKSHGSGPYYGLRLWRFRFSLGGYGWSTPFWKPHYTRYYRTAIHAGVGPTCLTILLGKYSGKNP